MVWCGVVCGVIEPSQHQHLEHALTHLVFTQFSSLTNTVFLPLDKDDLSSSPVRIETFSGKDGARGVCFVQFVSSGGFS